MNNKILTLIVAISFITFQGCKDDDDTTTVTKTKTELLTASPWVLSALTVNPGIDDGEGNTITDFYAESDACDNDDEEVYKTDGTGIYNEGATKCDPDDEQVYGTFNWSFNTDETTINIDQEVYTLSELSETTMVQSSTEEDGGITYTYTATYRH